MPSSQRKNQRRRSTAKRRQERPARKAGRAAKAVPQEIRSRGRADQTATKPRTPQALVAPWLKAALAAAVVLFAVSAQSGFSPWAGIAPARADQSGSSPWFALRLPTLAPMTSVAFPPTTVKAIYYTSWSAGVPSRMEEAITLIHGSALNAVVIDLKDFSGKVVFETSSPLIKRIGSEQRRIGDLRQLVGHLHQEGVYVIGRIAVFQDQHLVSVRPDLAVKNATGGVWRDRRGLGWVDPASREVWEYAAEVAREAAKAGIDELNFDYVRFPSDGTLSSIRYPFYDEQKESKRAVIRNLFAFLAEALAPTGKARSVDLFGLATVRPDDLGIGQVIEDALLYFDYVCPMVYPSHYAPGFLQFRNPAAYPYEVIHYSLAAALARQARFAQTIAPIVRGSLADDPGDTLTPPAKLARFRPWLQAFDLGAVYTPAMIRKQMQAVYDVGITDGWYLWNPSNVYVPASVEPRQAPALTTTARP